MGEPDIDRGGDNRRMLIMASVVVVVSLIVLAIFFRSCSPLQPQGDGYTSIYSNLDLRDAANVVTVLKALKIPYKIKNDGKTIAVPREKADDARLGLAEKNLPSGGSVGWEIFDQSKLGATDFDRQVQFMRALSGELSRTISRIEAVEDARVQIVIPKTELFTVTTAPVTASVLMQLKPGRRLSREQVNGIVRLVASSVENLRPENVIIVDIYGNILNASAIGGTDNSVNPQNLPGAEQSFIPEQQTKEAVEVAPTKEAVQPPKVAPVTLVATPAAVSAPATKEESVIPVPEKKLFLPEEKELSKLKVKEEIEGRLSSKIQKMVNRFYPPNSILVKVNVELGEQAVKAKAVKTPKAAKRLSKHAKLMKKAKVIAAAPKKKGQVVVKKMTVIILVDNRFNLSKQLKKTTFETVSSAVSYKSGRDRIILRQVPFTVAISMPVSAPVRGVPMKLLKLLMASKYVQASGAGALLLLLVIVIVMRMAGRRRPIDQVTVERGEQIPVEDRSSAIEQIRIAVMRTPEKVVDLLKAWLGNERGQ